MFTISCIYDGKKTTIELCCRRMLEIDRQYNVWSIRELYDVTSEHSYLLNPNKDLLFLGNRSFGEHCPFCGQKINVIMKNDI